MDEWNNKCLQLSYGRDFPFSSQLGKNIKLLQDFPCMMLITLLKTLIQCAKYFALRNIHKLLENVFCCCG